MQEIVFAVIATFLVGHGQTEDYQRECRDQKCIEQIREQAFTSPNIIRIRVTTKPYMVNKTSGSLVFPPLIDEWYR